MHKSESSLVEFFSLDNISKEKLSQIVKTKEFVRFKETLSKKLPGVPMTEAFFEMVIAELSKLLNIDVRAILLSAWNKSGDILQYADPQKYDQKKTFMIPLAEHTILSEHEPSLHFSFSKIPLGEIKLNISLQLNLKGAFLKIQNSRIMAFLIGSCQGKGWVKYGEVSLFERKSDTFTLPGSIELGAGIPLNAKTADIHQRIDIIAKA